VLPVAEAVAVRQHRADEGRIVVGKKDVEGHQRCEATIDRAGLIAFGRLLRDKAIHVMEVDRLWDAVADCCGELTQVVAVIAPGAGRRVATAQPIDEGFDLR